MNEMSNFYDDPLGYVLSAFPWGVEGTELEDEIGPNKWQIDQMLRIQRAIRDDPEGFQVREAMVCDHGEGKSAMTSWIILWVMSTRPYSGGIVTSNTAHQLRETWKELAKWHKLSINSHWFTWSATKFGHNNCHGAWGMVAIPSSKSKPEAFAGMVSKHPLVIIDGASIVPDVIWEVMESCTACPMSIWLTYDRVIPSQGRFKECFTPLCEWAHN